MSHFIEFFGAAQQVTGSCISLTTDSGKYLIDCGLDQSKSAHAGKSEFAFNPKDYDALFLTHGHLDHVGRVPELFERGFEGPIFCHYATFELATLIWQDTLKISMQNGMPAYSQESLEKAIGKVQFLDYEQAFEFKDLKGMLFNSGHILGSSHIALKTDNKSILFSGDIGVELTPIIEDPNYQWPPEFSSFDAVVIESTYGNRMHKSKEKTIEEFKALILNASKNKGVILIPSFSIGRTQEILYHFNTLTESGQIKKLPIFLDSPMAKKVTKIYSQYTVCYDEEALALIEAGDKPFEFPGFHAIENYRQHKMLENFRPPFVIIAGSGICTGGRIIEHLKNFLPKQNTTVLMVGYQGEGSLGRELVEGRKTVTIDDCKIPVRAEIVTMGGFSAHADSQGLMKWARNVPGGNKKWFVNHGENGAAKALARELEGQGMGDAIVPMVGREYGV